MNYKLGIFQHWPIFVLFTVGTSPLGRTVYHRSNSISKVVHTVYTVYPRIGNIYVYIAWKPTSVRMFQNFLRRYVFQNPTRFHVMTQLRPWDDLDRNDLEWSGKNTDVGRGDVNVALIKFCANNLPKIKLRILPNVDTGRPTSATPVLLKVDCRPTRLKSIEGKKIWTRKVHVHSNLVWQ